MAEPFDAETADTLRTPCAYCPPPCREVDDAAALSKLTPFDPRTASGPSDLAAAIIVVGVLAAIVVGRLLGLHP